MGSWAEHLDALSCSASQWRMETPCHVEPRPMLIRPRLLTRLGAAAIGAASTALPSLAQSTESMFGNAAPNLRTPEEIKANNQKVLEMQTQLTIESEAEMAPPHLSIREILLGNGSAAEPGMWVSAHVRVTLLGDGTVVEDTRKSGRGDRDYGQPLVFQLGDLGAANVLRALHPVVLDMRVGGQRRVRTSLTDKNWGYKEMPRLYQPREPLGTDQRSACRRHVQGDWLMDVTIELLDVSISQPLTPFEQVIGETASGWLRAYLNLGRGQRADRGPGRA